MSDTAILGSIAAALTAVVSLLVYVTKRKPNGSRLSVEEEIARNIALIERLNIDLPRNWREWTDERIDHKLRNIRQRSIAYANLLEHGRVDTVIAFLKEDAEE